MTFNQLTNQLQQEGWRAYYIPHLVISKRMETLLQILAVRSLIEIQIYEGKNIIFVKTIHPPIEKENNND